MGGAHLNEKKSDMLCAHELSASPVEEEEKQKRLLEWGGERKGRNDILISIQRFVFLVKLKWRIKLKNNRHQMSHGF